ncbi:MAG: hypothetical protein WBK46_09185, partial [Ruminococcus flavefaciens]
IYTVGIVIIGLFHEVWFDEAQAWQIARCASLKEMIFEISHYEGHPPLWYLILAVFAKNGAPPVFTLKAVNTVISAASIAVLLYKSPFPKIIRCGLPFTYFLFYRYGVNTRPYCIMMLAFFLAASFYKERNEHPWKYILSLTLLCLSSAYGIIIAGGLCLVWTFEIFSEYIKKHSFKGVFKDKRAYSLAFILVIAVGLILLILPADDVYYGGITSQGTFLQEMQTYDFWNKLLDSPLDSWSTKFIKARVPGIAVLPLGLLSWIILISIAKKNKKTLTFIVPYLMLIVFWAYKYIAPHHLGISTLFHIFFFWIILNENGKIAFPEYFYKISNCINSAIIKKAFFSLITVLCLTPFYFSIAASCLEIKYYYGNAEFVEFIKKHNIENKKLMLLWETEYEKTNENNEDSIDIQALDCASALVEIPFNHHKIDQNFTSICGLGATLSLHFDRNIFMNFNVDCPDDLYMHYKYKEDSEKIMKMWHEQGLPDFIFGPAIIDEVYTPEELEGIRYLPVFASTNVLINKDVINSAVMEIYMREDLFDDYPDIHWIYDPKADLYEIKHDD